jgi:chaperonin cofactor prefoldin
MSNNNNLSNEQQLALKEAQEAQNTFQKLKEDVNQLVVSRQKLLTQKNENELVLKEFLLLKEETTV